MRRLVDELEDSQQPASSDYNFLTHKSQKEPSSSGGSAVTSAGSIGQRDDEGKATRSALEQQEPPWSIFGNNPDRRGEGSLIYLIIDLLRDLQATRSPQRRKDSQLLTREQVLFATPSSPLKRPVEEGGYSS